MSTILASCPPWCTHDSASAVDTLDETRTHHSDGSTIALDEEGTALRVWLEQVRYPQPLAGEAEPPALLMLELLRPADDCTHRRIEVLTLGPASRWARTLRLAHDELAAEIRWVNIASDERPDWRFHIIAAARELKGTSLAVARHAGLAPRATLSVGFEEATTGLIGLREVASAIEAELSGALDAVIL